MTDCKSCGHGNAPESAYCNLCGKPLGTETATGPGRKATDPSDRIMVSRDVMGEVTVERIRPAGRFFRQTCPWCGRSVKVPEDEESCPFCARSLDRSGPDFQEEAALSAPEPREPGRPVAALLHRLPGGEEVRIELRHRRCFAGRTRGVPESLVFPADLYLSPLHAEFAYEGDRVRVIDRGSVNGIFLLIREPRTLEPGLRLLLGEQVFRFEEVAAETIRDRGEAEGTMPLGSGIERPGAKLVKVLADGGDGPEYHLGARPRIFGRQGGHYGFPDDPLLSQRHASIEEREGRFRITDLGSTNGSFVQVHDHVLAAGDVLRMGSQRFRIEYGPAPGARRGGSV